MRTSMLLTSPGGGTTVRFTTNDRTGRVTRTVKSGNRTTKSRVSLEDARARIANLRGAGFKVQTRATASVEGS